MTFLRWAGSKKQLLDALTCCWFAATRGSPEKARYIEAFSGSAALFFRIAPKAAILVDINADLQQCLSRVKVSPSAVSRELEQYESSEAEYYRVRAQSTAEMTENQKAARFIYLNRNCFNGLYRTNRKGQFNVPFGGGRSGSLPSSELLLNASRTLKSAELFTGDFYEVIAPRLKANDFVYLDPPYARRNVGLDNQYGPDVFGEQDIDRLTKLAEVMHKKKANFIISYANCDEVQALASRWSKYEVTVQRKIAANVANRGPVKELLITNM